MSRARLLVAVGCSALAAAVATGVVFAGDVNRHRQRPPVRVRSVAVERTKAKSSDESTGGDLADQLVGAVNQGTKEMGNKGKISKASCLRGAPGSYACSYVRKAPGKTADCAVALIRRTRQAGLVKLTVQAAGKVSLPPSRCGPVTKVLYALGATG